MARCIEYTASSAVNAEPSWNFTPWRSVKRICVGLISFHAVASTGDAQALPLEQMRYQGWMQQDSRRVALVQAGSLLHLVRAGEALGAEQARVLSMDDTQLLLRLPDGAGVQRLALQQEQP